MDTPISMLRKYWKYEQFRPLQEEIIHAVLNNKHTLAVLPTGGGKSLCYQVPALLMPGICIVVSPLIALMKDQADRLLSMNISAHVIHAKLQADEIREIYEIAAQGELKFLFVSPERLQSPLFKAYLEIWSVSLLAIDEAHCISQWGFDFRPAYQSIQDILPIIPHTHIVALTASATQHVMQDIAVQLHAKNAVIFSGGFERNNIVFQRVQCENKIYEVKRVLQQYSGAAIIYCNSRKATMSVAHMLQKEGFAANYYHAGLSYEERNSKQNQWLENKIQIIVCTNAFGMGIDKADVRIVIHFDLPESPEAYYQEAGRAGRDGKLAHAILLYQARDLRELHDRIALRYPNENFLTDVYFSLFNYFEIGIGDGEGQTFDLDIVDFATKFKFSTLATSYALKLLAIQGFIEFNENVLLPPKIQCIISENQLHIVQATHPLLVKIIDALIRTYPGIYHHPVTVNLFQLMQHTHISKDALHEGLIVLHQLQWIHYIPAKDKPFIYFYSGRPHKLAFTLQRHLLEKLKKLYAARVEYMIAYASQKETCVAVFLYRYFSSDHAENCQHCDVCKQSARLTMQSTEAIKNNLLQQLSLQHKLSVKSFITNYPVSMHSQIHTIIRHMLDEGIVIHDIAGFIKKI